MPTPSSVSGGPRPRRFDTATDSAGNLLDHEVYQAIRRRTEIVRANFSRTFHLLSELPQELQILLWKHAGDAAVAWDLDDPPPYNDDHDPYSYPSLSSHYADDIRLGAIVLPSRNGLLWICRLSRQVFLEDWKKGIEHAIKTPLDGGGLGFRGWREAKHRELLEDVTKQLERLKN